MPDNPVRSSLREGRSVVSGWLTAGHPLLAEVMGSAGYDAVTVDMQHGAVSDHELLSVLYAISCTDAVPLVRVPWNLPAQVMKALDLGALGVIAPMIEGPEDVEALVAACRYPPQGRRSYGPTRNPFSPGAFSPSRANESVMAIAMIETKAALDALDEILSVPGLDMVFVGPSDLSQALGGGPGSDHEDGPVPDALARIVDAAQRHDVAAGVFCRDAAYAARMIDAGFRFVTADSDMGLLRRGAAAALVTARGTA